MENNENEIINLQTEFSDYQLIEKEKTSYLILDKPYLHFSKNIHE